MRATTVVTTFLAVVCWLLAPQVAATGASFPGTGPTTSGGLLPVLHLAPACLPSGTATVAVRGYNWPSGDTLVVTGPDGYADLFSTLSGYFEKEWALVDLAPGTYAFSAFNLTQGTSPVTAQLTVGACDRPVDSALHSPGLQAREQPEPRLLFELENVFGPHICTAYGDPYTPFRRGSGAPNPWRPLDTLATYRYRIAIPPDYETAAGTSLLRVELFDPDSSNVDVSTPITIVHTAAFASANVLSTTLSTACTGLPQRDACVITTCEWSAQPDCGAVDQFPVDDANPYWLVRVDSNRGHGLAPGDGSCGSPATYDPGYNTETAFALGYVDNAGQVRPLVTYSGQPAFAAEADHGTDLHWVTPGAGNLIDNALGGVVPADCASPNGGYSLPGDDLLPMDERRCAVREPGSDTWIAPPYAPPGTGSGFEVDLAQDVPGIYVDPLTGQRYLLLTVTALRGSAGNAFDLWAGPPQPDLPADGNLRNVFLLDNPGAGDPAGVAILAVNARQRTTVAFNSMPLQLHYLGPEYAGRTVAVAFFDADSGTQGPVTVFFDSVPREEFEVVFVGFDCLGSCNDGWVGEPGGQSPPFLVTVPATVGGCGQPPCPFPGGTLLAEYTSATGDTIVIQVANPILDLLLPLIPAP